MQILIYFAYPLHNMPRHKKEIPLEDVKYNLKGLKTLIGEGKTQDEIAEYYKKHGIEVTQSTICRRIQDINKE